MYAVINTCWKGAAAVTGRRALSTASDDLAGMFIIITKITYPSDALSEPQTAEGLASNCTSPSSMTSIFTPDVMKLYGITSLPTTSFALILVPSSNPGQFLHYLEG